MMWCNTFNAAKVPQQGVVIHSWLTLAVFFVLTVDSPTTSRMDEGPVGIYPEVSNSRSLPAVQQQQHRFSSFVWMKRSQHVRHTCFLNVINGVCSPGGSM